MATQTKSKTAVICVYPFKGTLYCQMTYRSETLRHETGDDRLALVKAARADAQQRGFTHARIFHEHENPEHNTKGRVALY